jgi:hypothetical protein
MTDIPDLPPVLERLLEGGEHDAVGAYALGALPSAERIAFESHLARCTQCQSELVLLRQSADILRRALVPDGNLSEASVTAPPPASSPPAAAPLSAANGIAGDEEPSHVDETEAHPATQEPDPEAPLVSEEPEVEAPTAGFEPPPIDTATLPELQELGTETSEAAAPAVEEDAQAELAEPLIGPVLEPAVVEEPVAHPLAEETVPVQPPRRTRPRGRVAPGVQPPAEVMQAAAPAPRSRLPWIVAALGLAVGIGAVLAALSLAEMKGNLEDEIDFQNAQIAELNAQRDTYLEQTSAIAWTLAPTTLGDPNSTGIVYADPAGSSALLSVTDMAALADNQTYQAWYLPSGDAPPVAGPVFAVDETGGAVVQITPDLSSYQSLAVTIEPEGGSEEPTSNPVMQGFVSVQ